MEMGDDEIGVVHLQVDRHGGQHHAGQPAGDEDEEEAEHEQQRRPEDRPSAPEGRQPAEDLQAIWNGDHHAGCGEEAGAELGQPGREHVVDPEAEGEKAHRDQRKHQRQIAEHRTSRERDDDRRDHAGRRQEDDVDLRMAEEPEQVLEQQHVAALGRVEDVGADQPVENQEGARRSSPPAWRR